VNVRAGEHTSASVSEVITFIVGLAGVVSGGALTHAYTLRRERRTEFTHALDRVVQSFTAADRALSHLITVTEARQGQTVGVEAAERVTECEIEMRGAHRSMCLRLKRGHPLETAFAEVHGAFTAGYTCLTAAFVANVRGNKWGAEADAAVAAAHEGRAHFEDQFAVALDVARDTVGAVR
jgi:hypothetical protein